MGSYMGVSGKARKDTKGYFGVEGKARKVVKAYIGDALGKARLWFSSALPGSGKLGLHFASSELTHIVKTTDDGSNFTESTVTLSRTTDSSNLSYIRGINRWCVADYFITSDDKLSGALTYSSSRWSSIVNGYRFVGDGVLSLKAYKVNADLTETLIGTVPLFTSQPSTYTDYLIYSVATDGNGNFCCAYYASGTNTGTGYEYQTTYISFVLFSISGTTITVRQQVRNTSTSSASGETYASPAYSIYFTGDGFQIYGCQYRYNPSSDTFSTTYHRMYYASNTSPYSYSTVTLPSMQSDSDFSVITGRNDEYVYCTDGYKTYRSNKSGGSLTDITSIVKVDPIRSDGEYFYNDWMKKTSGGIWSINRAKPGDAVATVISTSAPANDIWAALAYKDQNGTYQQY